MFRNLGIVEIDFTSREIIREAIKFFRNAPQDFLHVRLGGYVRQSPGVVGLCMIIG
jgi:hypothetical protein